VQIRFSDLDALDHVNNGFIAQYYDLGRINYFSAAFGRRLDWTQVVVVIVHLETDFLAPIHQNDNIYVETKLTKFGKKSMHTIQRLVDKTTGEVKSTCIAILSGFDRSTNKSMEISEDFKQVFYRYEQGLPPIDTTNITE